MSEDKRNIELEIKEDLEIHVDDIFGDLAKHPVKYFFWGTTWARASKAVRQKKLALKETGARLANGLRREWADAGADPKTKVTEAMINNFLFQHTDYLDAERALSQAEYMEEVLEIARYGMMEKGRALQELAKASRAEELYGSEFSAMRKEFDERVREVPKRGSRKEGVNQAENI